MPTVWDKLDQGLSDIYATYVAEPDSEERRLMVSLVYDGDLDEITALGFEPLGQQAPGREVGALALSDVKRIAAHPGVRELIAGSEPEVQLDQSIPDVRADAVWTLSSGTFSGDTGAGAIVGVIDTGIDIHHPYFRSTNTPRTTRILRVWDQGLEPVGLEASPDPALLTPGGTYGVEYTDAQINDVLRGAVGARHRDCAGHGTHVASTAAGDGRDVFKFVGVAPEAQLVVVKYLFPEKDPKIGGVQVLSTKRFKDAVSYIRGVAAAAGRPVVINCSFGSTVGPHDGLSETEDWLTENFATATGEVLVSAAGNDGGKRGHARIHIPAPGGTCDLTFQLTDPRANRVDHDLCRVAPNTRALHITLYYAPGGVRPTFTLRLPGGGPPVAAPAFGGHLPGTLGSNAWDMWHRAENTTLLTRGVVTREAYTFRITPHSNRHRLGDYVLHIACAGAFTGHLWCSRGQGYGFKIAPGPIANATVEDLTLIGSNGGAAHVVTVAAYDAEDKPALPVTSFSSRGPLAHYSGPAAPAKPDIGAPGKAIDAAKTRDWVPPAIGPTVPMQGTSMASPHVAGAIALMLADKPTLTNAQVLATLRAQARTVPPPINAAELGAGRLDAKAAFDNTP